MALKTVTPKPQARERTIEPLERTEQFSEAFRYALEKYVARSRKPFEIDEENERVVKALLLYFSENPAFEACEWSSEKGELRSKPELGKGLLICGNVGSGKTLLFNLFNSCFEPEHRSRVVPCDIVTDKVRKEGVAGMEPFSSVYLSGGRRNEIMFDDLGIESRAKYYGDDINPMFDLIIKRYRSFCDAGLKTHFTTNLAPAKFAEYYDDRTDSRLREMCNIIVLGASISSKDRRK